MTAPAPICERCQCTAHRDGKCPNRWCGCKRHREHKA